MNTERVLQWAATRLKGKLANPFSCKHGLRQVAWGQWEQTSGHNQTNENMEQVTHHNLRSLSYTCNHKVYLQQSPLKPVLLVKMKTLCSFICCFSLLCFFQLLIAGDINLQSKQTYSKYKIVVKAVHCVTFKMHFFSIKTTFLKLKYAWNMCYRSRPTQTLSVRSCLCRKKFTFSFWQVCLFDISAYITQRKIYISVAMSPDALLLRHMMLHPGLQEELHSKLMCLRASGYVAP